MNARLRSKGLLLDLDGTLISGSLPLPWAARLLAASRARCVVVSNDAEHTPSEVSDLLHRCGLRVPAHRIVLAGTATLDLIAAERPGARILLLGSTSLRRYATSLGLRLDTRRPDVVVLSRDRSLTYSKLECAANAVRRGASLIVTNPDRTHPGPNGTVVPETGALLAALLACTGPVDHRIVGKPEPALFLRGLALLGMGPTEVLMIGDNPETDGIGAARAGIPFAEIGEWLATDTRRIASPSSRVLDAV